jgi:small subunit ribosomal protein S17
VYVIFATEMVSAELRLEDTVFIRHTRPISARKRFMLEKILKSPIGEAAATKAALAAAATNPPQYPAAPSRS